MKSLKMDWRKKIKKTSPQRRKNNKTKKKKKSNVESFFPSPT
jgi:hypothetical protein